MTDTARIYARLSDHSNRSIQGQIDDCREYADRQGFNIDHVYNEGQGQSGWDESRDEYSLMLNDAESGEFNALIVRDGSRFGRDKRERIRRFFDLDDWGVQLHTVSRGYVDPEDPSDFLMEVFKAMSDDHGKRGEVERLEAEMEKRRQNGWFIGEPPAGLQYDEEKQYLEAVKGEIDDVMRVYQLRDEGATYRDIAEEVPWTLPTIGKLIDRREQYESVKNGAVLGRDLTIVRPKPTES
ncbi:recombinase family protein [Halobacteria archaeon AArc-m2/3/4]|uniref:Recombinase family protein n=1 Tax=Natronoglomus mannanivorans TaxID=2979990 RepID=A0ABT2Q883_9EURY|nr:recombinase family protein [Halobacteria archaeon AArc-m2/3/4]